LLDKKKIYSKAIQEFNYCIEKNSNYACYFELSLAYYFNRQLKLALAIAQKGFNNKSETSFLWIMGLCYFDLHNYIEAIRYFNKYLETRESQTIESMLIKSKQLSFLCYIRRFKKTLSKKKIMRSIKLFERLLEDNKKVIENDDLKNYYYCLIAQEKPNLDIQYKNPYYERLAKIHRTAFLNRETTKSDYPLQKSYGRRSTLKFGKHLDKSIIKIIEDDPNYILWCLINLDHFIIDTELLNDSRLKNQKNYLKALELFLVKDLFLNRNASFGSDNTSSGGWDPYELGYSSWDEMNFYEAFEGNQGAWDHFNQ
jgi:tetratricopeptide (TPR) repeat protein